MPFDADDLADFINPEMPNWAEADVDGVTAGVLFRKADEDVLGDSQILAQPVMVYRDIDFPGIARNSAVTIHGVAYVVREPKSHRSLPGMSMATLKAS